MTSYRETKGQAVKESRLHPKKALEGKYVPRDASEFPPLRLRISLLAFRQAVLDSIQECSWRSCPQDTAPHNADDMMCCQ